jgi:thiol-disulfide isomerase/thioredoxin
MELKNAVAVCLITLFSATVVVLIARSLDSQAASRLEPQLARIVEELEAIRKSGGITAGAGVAVESQSVDDAVMVYYFHGNTRCPTCRSIESQAHEAVQSDFVSEVENEQVIWKVLNYEEPAGTELGKKFEVQMPVVVLARMNSGQIEDWKRLDQVWALVGDKQAFREYLHEEIAGMLGGDQPSPTAPDLNVPAIPVPEAEPGSISLPAGPGEIPVPQ